jgi:hypothetical protein
MSAFGGKADIGEDNYPLLTHSRHEPLRVLPLKQRIADDSLIKVELANFCVAQLQHVAQYLFIVFS